MKTYDVYFGKIDGRNFVPGQEGETRLSETKTYSYGYSSETYALLTEKDGQFFVRKYQFQPELDRAGAGRYDPDILSIVSEDTFDNREDADKKITQIADKFEADRINAYEDARDKIEGNLTNARDFAKFQGIQREKVVATFINDLIKTPWQIGNHFANASSRMEDARDWFIGNAATMRVVADHALHLDPNDTENRMTQIIAIASDWKRDRRTTLVGDYFGDIKGRSAPSADNL